MKKNILSSMIKLAACAFLAIGTMVQAQDANGTWKWSQPGRNGGPDRVTTLTLKVDGEKLTGKIVTPMRQATNEVEIAEGKVKGADISFTVTREFNGNKMVSKYSGKVEKDEINGKVEMDRGGQTNSRDWKATREKK